MTNIKPFVEQRMFTEMGQISVVQPNENNNGVVLSTQEAFNQVKDARLYLTFNEVNALCDMLKSAVERIK